MFVPKHGAPVELRNITSVAQGWKNQQDGVWLPARLDTWIQVIFGDHGESSAIYLNDPRFLLMAAYFPHKKLITSLRGLVQK